MSLTLPLALYAAVTRAAEPLAPGLLRRRAAGGKEDASRLGERLGRPTIARPEGPLVWLHGVSVGESLSLLPLIQAIRARRPRIGILVTSGTVTSAQVLGGRLPPGVLHQFVPIDAPGAAAGFLDHWRPGAGLLVESELWPNLIAAARRRDIPLALVSARMSQASAQGWGRARGSAQALLGAFDLVLPQDRASGARLRALGARIGPDLNLKLVTRPPPVDAVQVEALRAALGGRKAILAASTHPGEEQLVAKAFKAAKTDGALLIVAPRHPDRGPAVAAELAEAGFGVARRGAGQPLDADTSAYVVDTLGELGAFYVVAEAVVMGGSLVAGIGGHNPMEPAALGRAVVTGPHVANAKAIYEAMFAEVAAIEAADGAALTRHVAGLLANPAIAQRIGEAGAAFARRQGAALDAAMALIEPLLPA